MSQQLSKWNLPICPEVCSACRDGIHCFHVIDELGDLFVTHSAKSYKDEAYGCYQIHGSVESSADNFWLKRIFEYTNKVLQETK